MLPPGDTMPTLVDIRTLNAEAVAAAAAEVGLNVDEYAEVILTPEERAAYRAAAAQAGAAYDEAEAPAWAAYEEAVAPARAAYDAAVDTAWAAYEAAVAEALCAILATRP